MYIIMYPCFNFNFTVRIKVGHHGSNTDISGWRNSLGLVSHCRRAPFGDTIGTHTPHLGQVREAYSTLYICELLVHATLCKEACQ